MSTPIREILLLHHSHTDIGYTNYQDTVFARQRDHVRHAIHLAERYADAPDEARFRWTCETTIMVEDFLRTARDSDIERLQSVHQAGLIDFGGMYTNVSPLYSTDLLARTFTAAERLRRDYGFRVRYALNCDVNGQAWGLVEMLLDAGFEGLVMAINRAMAPDPQPRPIGFRWAGPSGRTLLTWHGAHYGDGNNLGIPRLGTPSGAKRWWHVDLDGTRPNIERYINDLHAKGYPYDFAFLQIVNSFTWDNDGPDEALSPFVQEWNARGCLPRLRIVTLDGLFERLSDVPPEQIETRAGDWNDWWAQGVGSSAFETALARRAHERLFAVEMLNALVPAPDTDSTVIADSHEAVRRLSIFDEHTWGSSESVSHPDSPQSRGQWYKKASYVYDADAALSRMVQSVGMRLAGQVAASDQPQILLFNPLPWSRRVPLCLPVVGRSGWELDRLARDLEAGGPQSAVPSVVDYGVIDLPAGGYTTLDVQVGLPEPLANDAVAPEFVPRPPANPSRRSRVTSHGWTLSNDFYTLRIDPTTGAIASLRSRSDGEEWVDPSAGWHIGQYVYEDLQTPRGRADIQLPSPDQDYDYRPHLAARRRGIHRVLEARTVAGDGATRFVMSCEAPGVHGLSIQVVLYDELPWIDLVYDIDKIAVASPESVYVTFPFALADPPVARYETAGAWVVAEAQQITNACRDFYAVQRWVDLNDGRRGVTVATPDCPLLHLGGFTNHKHQPHLELEQPYLVSWWMNNHWWTNFLQKQSGWTRARYRLVPYAGAFDPVRAVRVGLEAAVDPIVVPLKDHAPGLLHRSSDASRQRPAVDHLFDVTPDTVQLVTLKAADDGEGMIVRLQEIAGRESTASLAFANATVYGAVECSLTESPLREGREVSIDQGRVLLNIEPYRLVTLRIRLGGS